MTAFTAEQDSFGCWPCWHSTDWSWLWWCVTAFMHIYTPLELHNQFYFSSIQFYSIYPGSSAVVQISKMSQNCGNENWTPSTCTAVCISIFEYMYGINNQKITVGKVIRIVHFVFFFIYSSQWMICIFLFPSKVARSKSTNIVWVGKQKCHMHTYIYLTSQRDGNKDMRG